MNFIDVKYPIHSNEYQSYDVHQEAIELVQKKSIIHNIIMRRKLNFLMEFMNIGKL